MVVYNCYIYNKQGECIFYKDFNASRLASSGTNTPNSPQTAQMFEKQRSKKELIRLEGDMKLMYGLVYSLKAFVQGIAPKENENFRSFNTSTYKLHFYESPTGFKFIFLTDTNAPDFDNQMTDIYTKFFVPYVISNPLYNLHEKINCYLFADSVTRYVDTYMQWVNRRQSLLLLLLRLDMIITTAYSLTRSYVQLPGMWQTKTEGMLHWATRKNMQKKLMQTNIVQKKKINL